MQPEIPTRARVTIIYSRADRFALHCEYAAMPLGVGMTAGALFGAFMGAILDFGPTLWDFGLMTLGPILIAYAVWQPIHRRYIMRRGDFWMAPEDIQ